MRPRISIRGCVRPSVRPSVRRSVRRSVRNGTNRSLFYLSFFHETMFTNYDLFFRCDSREASLRRSQIFFFLRLPHCMRPFILSVYNFVARIKDRFIPRIKDRFKGAKKWKKKGKTEEDYFLFLWEFRFRTKRKRLTKTRFVD